nr:hypothetical protein [Tanacetum cinerariifolium]
DDQADYPADGGDGDDEPSDDEDDDTDDEDPEEELFEEDDEEEEEHPASSDSPAVPIVDLAALLLPPLPIPSLPLPLPSPLTTSLTDTGAPLGYRAARIRMRALLSSTSRRTNIPEPGPTESDLRRCRVEQEGYGITDTWDEIVDKMMEIAPTTLEGVNERV